MLKVNDRISIPLREFEFRYSRSSGPGGQNVNKVNTRVQLRWDLSKSDALPEEIKQRFRQQFPRFVTEAGEVVVASQRFRDQGRNVADVLAKLAELIRVAAIPPKIRRPTRVSRSAKKRRLEEKRRNSEKKQRRQTLD